MKILLTNTLSNLKEIFKPINKNCVKMYICGPTIYDRIHVGNCRSVVVFDILYKLLSYFYPVYYIRNITDIDDKIINKLNNNNEKFSFFIKKMKKNFHQDLLFLKCKYPTYEPQATNNIRNIIKIINLLIKKKYAYVYSNNVYFKISNFYNYGYLSKKELTKQIINSDILMKKNNLDFALWKRYKIGEQISFNSPWGMGRPGWHIECSSMSQMHLGNYFDIHGGGRDLLFPHHENENAQSVCSNFNEKYSNYWIHNGHIIYCKKKMSKKLNNFFTIKELIKQKICPLSLKYFFFTTHYRKKLNFNIKSIFECQKIINKIKWCQKLCKNYYKKKNNISIKFINYLSNDLNTIDALLYINKMINEVMKGNYSNIITLLQCCDFLNLLPNNKKNNSYIKKLIIKRTINKKVKNWKKSDRLRKIIENYGYKIIDNKYNYQLF